ncbi:MAG: DUF2007 domain-containing protein [bacterium]|nr:DUF2007 domain-containing protein [bacterium]
MNELITIKTFNTRLEAEIAKGLLESNGIKSMIVADDAGGMYPFPFQAGFKGAELKVNKKDHSKASDIILKR